MEKRREAVSWYKRVSVCIITCFDELYLCFDKLIASIVKKDTAAEMAKKREQERQRLEKLAETSRLSRQRHCSRSRSYSRSPPRYIFWNTRTLCLSLTHMAHSKYFLYYCLIANQPKINEFLSPIYWLIYLLLWGNRGVSICCSSMSIFVFNPNGWQWISFAAE